MLLVTRVTVHVGHEHALDQSTSATNRRVVAVKSLDSKPRPRVASRQIDRYRVWLVHRLLGLRQQRLVEAPLAFDHVDAVEIVAPQLVTHLLLQRPMMLDSREPPRLLLRLLHRQDVPILCLDLHGEHCSLPISFRALQKPIAWYLTF